MRSHVREVLQFADARRCLAIEALLMVFFGTAVMQVYYRSHGLEQDQINNLQSISAMTWVIVEVPAGYLSDRFGRRRMLIVGLVFHSINAIYFARCTTYTQFCVSLVLTGVSVALVSGVTSSIMASNLQEGYHSYEWMAALSRRIGEIVGLGVGYLMMQRGSLETIFDHQYITYSLAFLIALRLRSASQRQGYLSMRHLTDTAKEMLMRRSQARWATLLFTSMGSGALLCWWVVQARLAEAGVEVIDFTYVYLLRCIGATGLAILVGMALHRRHARTALQIALLVVISGSALVSAVVSGTFGAYALVAGVTCSTQLLIVQRSTFHQILSSDTSLRTTQLSIASASEALYFAGLSVIFGKIAVLTSVRVTLGCIAAITFLVGIYAFVMLHRTSAQR